MSLENYCALAKRHLPEFYLHPKEEFFPCTVEWFLTHSQLVKTQDGQTVVVIPRGSLSLASLGEIADSSDYQMTLDPNFRAGQLAGKAAVSDPDACQLDDLPIYSHCKEVNVAGEDYIQLTFLTFYAYNGDHTIPVLGLKVGAHDGDWEHITLRCDPHTGDVVSAYYGAHRYGDGTWYPASQIPRNSQTGRIKAFVALRSHGIYARPGKHLRIFGLANDVTSDAGTVWRPKRCILLQTSEEAAAPGAALVASTPVVEQEGGEGVVDSAVAVKNALDVVVDVVTPSWWTYSGLFGAAHAPAKQAWWSQEHPKGSTPWRRMFCPCVKPPM